MEDQEVRRQYASEAIVSLKRTLKHMTDDFSLSKAMILLLWIFDLIQMLAFPLAMSPNLPWQGSSVMETVMSVLGPVMFLPTHSSDTPDALPVPAERLYYATIAYLIVVWGGFMWTVAAHWSTPKLRVTGRAFAEGEGVEGDKGAGGSFNGAMIGLATAKSAIKEEDITLYVPLWFISSVRVTAAVGLHALVVPITTALLSPFYCSEADGATWPLTTDMVLCFKGTHLGFFVVSIVLLPLWIAWLLMLATCIIDRVPDLSGKKNTLCASHGRVFGLVVIIKVFLSILHTFHESVTTWAYVLLQLAAGLAICFLYAYYQPYFNPRLNQVQAGLGAVITAAAVGLVMAQAIGDPSNPAGAVAFLILIPAALFVGYSLTEQRFRSFGRGAEMSTPFAVELRMRYLVHEAVQAIGFGHDAAKAFADQASNANSLYASEGDKSKGGGVVAEESETSLLLRNEAKDEAVEACLQAIDALVKDAVTAFGTSSLMLLFIANYQGVYKHNRHLERVYLKLAEQRADSMALDIKFFLFQAMAIMAEQDLFGNPSAGGNSTRMTVERRMQFERLMALSRVQTSECRQLQLSWWTELSNRTPDLARVQSLGKTINRALAETQETYKELLSLAPQSTVVLRAYAEFLLEISNDPNKAVELLADAEDIEDEQSRAHASSAEADTTFGKLCPEFDLSTESLGWIRVSAKPGPLFGTVIDANQAALKMWGYAKREVIGREMSFLLPEPIASIHARILERYNSTGQERVANQSRILIAQHRGGHIFPLKVNVKPTGDAFIAVAEELSTRLAFLFFLNGDHGWKVTAACKTCQLAFGIEAGAIKAGTVTMARLLQAADIPPAESVDAATSNGRRRSLSSIEVDLVHGLPAVHDPGQVIPLLQSANEPVTLLMAGVRVAARLQVAPIPFLSSAVYILRFTLQGGEVGKGGGAGVATGNKGQEEDGEEGDAASDAAAGENSEVGEDAPVPHAAGAAGTPIVRVSGASRSTPLAKDTIRGSRSGGAGATATNPHAELSPDADIAMCPVMGNSSRRKSTTDPAQGSARLPGQVGDMSPAPVPAPAPAAPVTSTTSTTKSSRDADLDLFGMLDEKVNTAGHSTALSMDANNRAMTGDASLVLGGSSITMGADPSTGGAGAGSSMRLPPKPASKGTQGILKKNSSVMIGGSTMLGESNGVASPIKAGPSSVSGPPSSAYGPPAQAQGHADEMDEAHTQPSKGKDGQPKTTRHISGNQSAYTKGTSSTDSSVTDVLRKGVAARAGKLEKALLKMRRTLLFVFLIIAGLNIVSEVVGTTLFGAMRNNIELVSLGGDRTRALRRVQGDLQNLVYAAEGKQLLPRGAQYYLDRMESSISRFESLHRSLYVQLDGENPEEEDLYRGSSVLLRELIPGTWTNRSTHTFMIRNASLVNAGLEFVSKVRMAATLGPSRITMNASSVYFGVYQTESMEPNAFPAALNRSMHLSDERSKGHAATVTTANLIVTVVAEVVLLLIVIGVMAPSVSRVLLSKQKVFNVLLEVPLPVIRALRGRIQRRIDSISKEEQENDIAVIDMEEEEGEMSEGRSGREDGSEGSGSATLQAALSKVNHGLSRGSSQAEEDEEDYDTCMEKLRSCACCRRGGRSSRVRDSGRSGALSAPHGSGSGSGSFASFTSFSSAPPTQKKRRHRKRRYRNASTSYIPVLARIAFPMLVYAAYFLVFWWYQDNMTSGAVSLKAELLAMKEYQTFIGVLNSNIRAAYASCDSDFVLNTLDAAENEMAFIQQLQDWLLYGNVDLKIRAGTQANPDVYRIALEDGCINSPSVIASSYDGDIENCRNFYGGVYAKGAQQGFKEYIANLRIATLQRRQAILAGDCTESGLVLETPTLQVIDDMRWYYLVAASQAMADARMEESTAFFNSYTTTSAVVVAISLAVLVVSWYAVYSPLVRSLDKEIKEVRLLLLLFPDEVSKSVPAIVQAGREMFNEGASVASGDSGSVGGRL